jgi:hypothetical protein
MAHRILLAAAAALAVFTVGGCDITTGPQKPAQSACNCNGTQPTQQTTTPPAPSEPYAPPQHDRRHREHGWHYAYDRQHENGGAHQYYWRRAYSEIAVQTYDYHSDSSSYVTGDDGDHRGVGDGHRRFHHDEHYDGGGAYAGGGVHGEGWIDGYGRHRDGGGASAGAPVHGEGRGDEARLHPWHGYDIDCPDNERDTHRRH